MQLCHLDCCVCNFICIFIFYKLIYYPAGLSLLTINITYKMIWSNVLKNWKNGIPFKYPSDIKERFQWNTSVLKNNGNTEYRQSFRVNNNLAQVQSLDEYSEYFKNSKNRYVVTFPNITKSEILF